MSQSAPTFSVSFVYCDEGAIRREFKAQVQAIPRKGEYIRPEAGSDIVVVHAVIYAVVEAENGDGKAVLPVVVLREATQEEAADIKSLAQV